jgi:hypothetical protein
MDAQEFEQWEVTIKESDENAQRTPVVAFPEGTPIQYVADFFARTLGEGEKILGIRHVGHILAFTGGVKGPIEIANPEIRSQAERA